MTINDASEQAFLVGAFATGTFPSSPIRYWIGLTDTAVEGTFAWVSGEAVTYTNWAGGEPNDNLGVEDWAVMNWNAPGNWNDCPNTGCDGHFGIIEIVPEPVTLAIFGLGLAGFGVARRRG